MLEGLSEGSWEQTACHSSERAGVEPDHAGTKHPAGTDHPLPSQAPRSGHGSRAPMGMVRKYKSGSNAGRQVQMEEGTD